MNILASKPVLQQGHFNTAYSYFARVEKWKPTEASHPEAPSPPVMKFPPGRLRSVCANTGAARINAPAIAVRAGPALVTALAVATLHDWPGCLLIRRASACTPHQEFQDDAWPHSGYQMSAR